MADPRTAHLSSGRNYRTVGQPAEPAEEKSVQAAAIRAGGQAPQQQQAQEQPQQQNLPSAVVSSYNAGGFDAVKRLDGWYDLPEWERIQMLGMLL